jgi:hypothetical protein
MRYTEVARPFVATKIHPHVFSLCLKPSEVRQFLRQLENQPGVRVFGIDQRNPARRVVFVGCTSRDRQGRLELEW